MDEFLSTIAQLRGPNGCPWDKEQDHRSLARYLLEEVYEVLEAIRENNTSKLKEELGDLLLQIALHAQIAKEKGEFDFQEIACAINKKIISRHPHVFSNTKVESTEQVMTQWEELKEKELLETNDKKPLFDNIPHVLPALLKALKISEKAASQGFEWRTFNELWDKVISELEELKTALADSTLANQKQEIELELGDILFTLVNVARWQKLNPEESLLLAIDKFCKRYYLMEELSTRPLKELTKDELETIWQQAKERVKSLASES